MDHIRPAGAGGGLAAVTDEADLPGRISQLMGADRRIGDDGTLGADPAGPLIGRAISGFQCYVLRGRFAQSEQEAGRGSNG